MSPVCNGRDAAVVFCNNGAIAHEVTVTAPTAARACTMISRAMVSIGEKRSENIGSFIHVNAALRRRAFLSTRCLTVKRSVVSFRSLCLVRCRRRHRFTYPKSFSVNHSVGHPVIVKGTCLANTPRVDALPKPLAGRIYGVAIVSKQ